MCFYCEAPRAACQCDCRMMKIKADAGLWLCMACNHHLREYPSIGKDEL